MYPDLVQGEVGEPGATVVDGALVVVVVVDGAAVVVVVDVVGAEVVVVVDAVVVEAEAVVDEVVDGAVVVGTGASVVVDVVISPFKVK